MSPTAQQLVDIHHKSGRTFRAAGVGSFVIDQGEGDPVICLHGVPSSSFLYRKVLPELAQRGLRGIAFDFPGMGLAERPTDFDYSWTGLTNWLGDAIDALGIDRCHLVVHDIGGPIGMEWASRHPERVLSLTILNSPVRVATFHRPWPMHPFSLPGIGEVWLRLMRKPMWAALFRFVGLQQQEAMTNNEINAYLTLLKRVDGGRAFLRIMRGFELTQEREDLLLAALDKLKGRTRLVWAESDTMLGGDRLREAQEALDTKEVHLLRGKHFLQEDNAAAIAALVATPIRNATTP